MKKITSLAKKLFAIIAAIAVVIAPVANVKAANQTIDLGPAKQAGKYIAGVTFSYKFTTSGQYLYCVNMQKNTAQNIKADLVTSGSKIDGGIIYILKNGFPEKSITGDTDKDYYITQTAIWWYLDETTGSRNLGEYFKESGSDEYNLRHYVKELVQAGIKHRNDSYSTETKFRITTDDTNMKLQGDFYVSNSIKVVEKQNVAKYTIKLENAPQGSIIEVDGKNVSGNTATVTGKDSFRIKVPATSATDKALSFKVTATAVGSTIYSAYQYHPRDNSMQDVALLEKNQKNVASTVTLNIAAASHVSILKVDSNTKQPLAGAVLVLKDSNGKELTRWTSSVNAHVIKGLANGTYTVEEAKAPEGYIRNTSVYKFTITDNHKNIRANFENAPQKIVVTITKVDDDTKQPLAGAVMVLKDVNGNIVYKFTSTLQPEVITDIEKGTYTLEELSAPEGYIRNTNVHKFTIDDNHLSHQITFANAKEVIVPDTASVSSIIMIILGIAITGFGLKFVYKNGQKTR